MILHRPTHPAGPRGYAMALFLVIMLVLTSLTLVILSSSQDDLTSSARTVDRASARALAQGALDEVYSEVLSSSTYLSSLSSGIPVVLTQDASHHLVLSPATNASPAWVNLQTGTPSLCAGQKVQSDCYELTLKPDTSLGSVGASTNSALVQVVVREGCTLGKCTYTRFQQHLRRRNYFDYLFYTQFSDLDPALYGPNAPLTQDQANTLCANRYALARTDITTGKPLPARDSRCVEIAYQGDRGATSRKDVIHAPIFTNDDHILTCGNPLFSDKVYVAGPGYAAKVYEPAQVLRPTDACTGTPDFSNAADATLVNQPQLLLPTSTTTAAQFAAIAPDRYRFNPATPGGTVSLTFTTTAGKTSIAVSGSTSDSAALSLPSTGVVYVAGNASVQGTLSGALSVYADGTLTVPGNLVYASNPTALPNTANATDILGLTSAGPIVVTQNLSGTPRYLDAILLSLDSTVYVPGWDSPAAFTSTPPTLDFFGAVASKYQGVFGGYDSSTGDLVSGYYKNFNYDTRLQSSITQPPYLASATTTSWLRQDTSEVASCTTGDALAPC